MKKTMLIIEICMLMIFVIGCNSYDSCFNDCAKYDCNAPQSGRASVFYVEKICNNTNITIGEYCYKICGNID